jgi:hypothetical protein
MDAAVLRSLPRSRIALVLVVCALLLGACSGGDSSDDGNTTGDKNAPTVKTAPLALGEVKVVSAGPPTDIDKKTREIVLKVSQKYLATAVHEPLNTGQIGDGYNTLFDPSVREAALVADRDALTEMPVGKVDSYTETTGKVQLSGLADNAGSLLYIGSRFTETVKAKTAAGPVSITRSTELTFAPSGKNWLVTAYRVAAARTTPAGTTTTTARSSGGTTP